MPTFPKAHRTSAPSPHRVRAVLLAIGLFGSCCATAGSLLYQPQFPDQREGYVPPAVLVGFNPQPEPPARLAIAGDLSSERPGVVLTGIDSGSVDLLLGIGGGHQRLADMTLLGESCGLDRDVALYPLFRTVGIPSTCRGAFIVNARFTDGSQLNLAVAIRASSGDVFVPPGRLAGFNPQPEPPAIPAIGLRVDLRGTDSDAVSVDLSLSDIHGNVIPLR